MNRTRISLLIACLLLAAWGLGAAAQEPEEEEHGHEAHAEGHDQGHQHEAHEAHKTEEHAAAPPTAAYLRNIAFVGGRTVQLAEAIPAEKYGWRPMEGVRSVSEALMHIAGANFFFAKRLGNVDPPEGVDVENLEQIKDKDRCLAILRQSLEHLEKGLQNVTDLYAGADVFGRPGTVEDIALIAVSHVHEHFGQLIAYARSNQVVPPWSQEG